MKRQWLTVGLAFLIGSAITQFSGCIGGTSVSGASMNVAVLCSSCGIPGAPYGSSYIVLLDQNTGNILAYGGFNEAPISLGQLKLTQAQR